MKMHTWMLLFVVISLYSATGMESSIKDDLSSSTNITGGSEMTRDATLPTTGRNF